MMEGPLVEGNRAPISQRRLVFCLGREFIHHYLIAHKGTAASRVYSIYQLNIEGLYEQHRRKPRSFWSLDNIKELARCLPFYTNPINRWEV